MRRRASGWIVVLVATGCSGGRPGSESQGSPPPPGSASPAAAAPGAFPEIDRTTPLPIPLPAVVAKVNGEPIPLRNVGIVARKSLEPRGPMPASEAPYVFRKALQEAIARELLFQEAQARKITPDDRAVEQAYNEARVAYRDEKRWEEALSLDQMDPHAFRGELRLQLTVEALMRQEDAKVPPSTRGEAEAFFKSHPEAFDSGQRLRCRHIQVKVDPGMSPEAKKKVRVVAEAIHHQLKEGEDFAKMAKAASSDSATAAQGGDLGELSASDMPEAFAKAAYALKPGQVSGIVETPVGFEIIKVEEKKPAVKVTFEQAQDQIKEYLDQKKRREALKALVDSLRARARIETFL